MNNKPLPVFGIAFIIVAFIFVFTFPLINEAISEDQVELYTATVITSEEEYGHSFLFKGTDGIRYTSIITATLEDGTEITIKEVLSHQPPKYYRGDEIKVFGLRGKYKFERQDLFAPWNENSDIIYIAIFAFGAIPITLGFKPKRN